jgi:hypothetical protein
LSRQDFIIMSNQKSQFVKAALLCVLLLPFPLLLFPQESIPAQASKPPSLKTLKGTVEKVEMVRGQGPASFLMKEKNGDLVFVQLGPIRYLIQKGFNLSVPDEIEVRGFEITRDEKLILVASEIKNQTQKLNLQLRDDQLRPLWRGGPRRGQSGQ